MKHDPNCFLAKHGVYERGEMPPCDGRLVHVHLLPRRLLRLTFPGANADAMEGIARLIASPATWVWACGGPMGNGGHHGMLDMARTLRLPRSAIPAATEEVAEQLGIGWWLDAEYGVQEEVL